jgi:phosphorylcholine metabolism protein LicD
MENYILNPDESYNLYKLLYEVIKLFDQNNIQYWACGGTFLGAIRCKGIIKWDDDLDLCVLYKDKEKLKQIIEKDDRFFFDSKPSNLVDKIYYKTGKYPFVDIFFMVSENDGSQIVYKCASSRAKDTWTNEYYLESEINPLKKVKFGSMEISIPNQYKRYFLATYGENWNKEGVISYDHKKDEVLVTPIKWNLSERDYEPAFPFYFEESFENSGKYFQNRWWQF